MFTVSQILSPLLPVALIAGQVQATVRLSEKGVFCINPTRIAIAGKIRVRCRRLLALVPNAHYSTLCVAVVVPWVALVDGWQ